MGDGMAGGALDHAAPGFGDSSRVADEINVEGVVAVRDRALLQAYLHVAVMVLVGSTTAPAAKFIVHSLPLTLIPVLRFAPGGDVFGATGVVWRGPGRLIRQDGWRLLLAAALCVPINQGFFLGATKLGLTSHVGLFYATCPLVVLLLAWGSGWSGLILGEWRVYC